MQPSDTTRLRASAPALARLSFWVPPERMAEFEMAYVEKVAPILERLGLVASSCQARTALEGIFSRLFEIQTPSHIAEIETALQRDGNWQETVQSLSTAFTADGIPDVFRHRLGIYSAPAGPGRVVPAGCGRGHWRTYDGVDGLPENHVRAVLQDRDGNLWFGTEVGACRYDGRTWATFAMQDGLGDNYVQAIFQDRDGQLWFGTRGGVSCYDGQTFTSFTVQDGLADNSVFSILQDREGTLWFGTGSFRADGRGVSRYNEQGFTTFSAQDGLTDDTVLSIFQDREGRLWFGTNGGVNRYDGRSFAAFSAQDGLAGDTVLSIFQDREERLWFGTNGGVSRYDGRCFITFTTDDGLAENVVRSIYQDQEGILWFCTQGGVSRYDGQKFTTFTSQNGLADNVVRSVCQDREGHLWFGTMGGGVSRYDGQRFITFTTDDGLAGNWVRSILQDREGRLWFGICGGGVCRYDGETFSTFSTQDGLLDVDVRLIFQDREGHVWVGTEYGLSRYDGEAWTSFTPEDGLPENPVFSIFQDREGSLWIGTISGVSRYDGRRFTSFTTDDGLIDNHVRSIFQGREGDLLIGTISGVSRYDGRHFTSFTAGDGLIDNNVRSIFQDREGDLWFGTMGGGVSRYDGQAWTTFTTGDGLAHNVVTSIFQDREGHLWFGTDGGVSRYDGQVFQTLTDRDGLPSNSMWSIFQDRDGYIWIGTVNGVTRYHPPAPSPPSAFIDGVVADQRYEGTTALEIPSSVRLTAFEFHGISFKTRPEAVVYQYRLEGYEAGWKTTDSGRAEYQDLPPGDYTFHVRAIDRDLNYSDPATVRLAVVLDPRIQALTEALSESGASSEFVGKSDALHRVQTQLSEIAQTDVTVLILGETGTGKGLAARAVHALSNRKMGPFIQVNCGAIPEGLVESELFGHEKGAFTGADTRKLGKVELAKGGTLLLDEIGDLARDTQVKLLQLLEERTFYRVGGTQSLQVEVRVITATNRDLAQMVAEERFREDLYFRLHAFPVRMPPLRERREDILLLAAYFMERMAMRMNKKITHLTLEAQAILMAYSWPGNVRELEHAVQRGVILCKGPTIGVEEIALEIQKDPGGPAEEVVTLAEHERQYIREVLEKTAWRIRGPHGAAVLLGLPESTLRSRMKKLGIVRPQQ